MVCANPKCERKIFAEPLAMTRPYGRHTYEVEERIRHEALGQTARKASETLSMQHIRKCLGVHQGTPTDGQGKP